MKNRPKPIFLIAALLSAMFASIASAASGAAPPQFEYYLPDGFHVTVVVNVRQALDAPAFQNMRDKLITDKIRAFAESFKTMTKTDPLKDINEVLYAGFLDGSKKADALILLRGKMEREGVLNFIRYSEQYKEIAVGAATLYEFWNKDSGELRSLAFLDDDILAMGRRGPVEKALRLAVGRGGKRQANEELYRNRLVSLQNGSLIRLVVVAPPEGVQVDNPIVDPALKTLRALGASVTLKESNLHLKIEVETSEAEMATRWREIVEGVAAAAQFLEEPPQVADMAKRVQLESKEATLSASFQISVEELLNLLAMHPDLKMLKQ